MRTSLIITLFWLVSALATGEDGGGNRDRRTPPPFPQGNAGIAARHPGDRGIAKDPAVIFAEDFEEGDIDRVMKRWDDHNKTGLSLAAGDIPAHSSGKHALLVTHVGGRGTGGHLYRRILPGYDRVFFRAYVKFAPDCFPLHHGVMNLCGYNPPSRWPQGHAGIRPRGDDRFSVSVEPHGKSWTWDYYTYWMEMRGSPPRGKTWGNSFIRDPGLKVERGKWTCIELMVKMNEPVSARNGELALWIDGRLVSRLGPGYPRGKWIWDKWTPGKGGTAIRWNDARSGPERFRVPAAGEPFPGFRWRSSGQLRINAVRLSVYITRAPAGKVSKVWFDDVVVAREYIGPLYSAQTVDHKNDAGLKSHVATRRHATCCGAGWPATQHNRPGKTFETVIKN